MRLTVVLVLLCGTLGFGQEGEPAPALKEVFRWTGRQVFSIQFDLAGKEAYFGGDHVLGRVPMPEFKAKAVKWPEPITELGLDADLRFLLIRNASNRTEFHDLPNLEERSFSIKYANTRADVPNPPGRGPCLITWDGSYAVLANAGTGIRVWTLDALMTKNRIVGEAGILLGQHRAMLNHVTALRFMGKSVVVGMENGFVEFIDYKTTANTPGGDKRNQHFGTKGVTLAEAGAFRPHPTDVASLAVTADQGTLITAGAEGKIKFWEVGKAIMERRAPIPGAKPEPQPKPATTMDGRYAILRPETGHLAIAQDRAVKIFDPKFSKELVALAVDPGLGRLVRLVFSPDGMRLGGIFCRCTYCDSATSPIPDPTRHPYEHGGPLVIWDVTGLK